MPILHVILILVVVGFIMWLINTYIPMARPIKSLLNVVVVIVLIVWLLQVFGVIGSLGSLRLK